MTPAAYSADDLRYRAEHIARDMGVPFEKVVEFIAGLGGIEQFVAPESVGGFLGFQEKVIVYCRRYLLDHLPAGQRDAVGFMAQRRNRFDRRDFEDAATPIMRKFGVQLSDWDAVLLAALHVPGLWHLRHYSGSLEQAIQDLTVYLEGRYPGMAKKKTPQEMMSHSAKRRDAMVPFCQEKLKELGIFEKPIESEQFYLKAWAMSWMQAMDSDIPIEELQTMFQARYQQAKESADLTAYLNGKARPPAEAPLFDFGETTTKLEQLPAPAIAAVAPKESTVAIDEPKPTPAAPPVTETPSAGDAIPEIAAQPVLAPADAKAAAKREATDLDTILPLLGHFSQVAPGDISYSCVLDEIDAGSSYAADVAVDDLVALGEEGKKAVEAHIRKSRNLTADMAVVFTWVETNPSLRSINDLKNRAYEHVDKVYQDKLSRDEKLDKIREAWGGLLAKDAICAFGDDGAFEKVHILCAKLEIKPEVKPETALITSTAAALAATQEQPAQNVVPFPAAFRLPTPVEFQTMLNYADLVVGSGLYPKLTSKAQAMLVMLKGYTLGADPLSSLDGIKPVPAQGGGYTLLYEGKFIKALVERTGKCEKFEVIGDNRKAQAIVKRKDRAENVYIYSIEDAEKAKLTGKENWVKNPVTMLKWRVIAQAIRIEFPEVYFFFAPKNDEEEEAA